MGHLKAYVFVVSFIALLFAMTIGETAKIYQVNGSANEWILINPTKFTAKIGSWKDTTIGPGDMTRGTARRCMWYPASGMVPEDPTKFPLDGHHGDDLNGSVLSYFLNVTSSCNIEVFLFWACKDRSIYVQIDDNPALSYTVGNVAHLSVTNWYWTTKYGKAPGFVSFSSVQPTPIALSAGVHKLNILPREPNLYLHQILLKVNSGGSQSAPTDAGQQTSTTDGVPWSGTEATPSFDYTYTKPSLSKPTVDMVTSTIKQKAETLSVFDTVNFEWLDYAVSGKAADTLSVSLSPSSETGVRGYVMYVQSMVPAIDSMKSLPATFGFSRLWKGAQVKGTYGASGFGYVGYAKMVGYSFDEMFNLSQAAIDSVYIGALPTFKSLSTPQIAPQANSSGVTGVPYICRSNNGQIRFFIPASNENASIRLQIFSASGKILHTYSAQGQNGSANSYLWDGRSDNGSEISNGKYFGILQSGAKRFVASFVYLR